MSAKTQEVKQAVLDALSKIEKMEDLEEFDLDQYLYGLCVGKEEE